MSRLMGHRVGLAVSGLVLAVAASVASPARALGAATSSPASRAAGTFAELATGAGNLAVLCGAAGQRPAGAPPAGLCRLPARPRRAAATGHTGSSATLLPVCLTYPGINDRCERWQARNANQPVASLVDPATGLTVLAVNTSSGGVATMAAVAYQTSTGRPRWTFSAAPLVPPGVATVSYALSATPNGAMVFLAGSITETVSLTQAPYTWYLVIGLDASTGRVRWANRYLGIPGGQANVPTAMTATSTEAVVTGYSIFPGNFQIHPYDYATAAFDARDGRLLWASRYAGAGGYNQPTAIAASPAGDRVYVTGFSQYLNAASTPVYQAATLAYSTRNGAQLWAATHPSPVTAGTSLGWALAVTRSAVYLAGDQQYAGTTSQPLYGFETDAFTPSGRRLWSALHVTATGTEDLVAALTVAGDRIVLTGATSGESQNLAAGASVTVPAAETIGYDPGGRLRWADVYAPPAHYLSGATALSAGPHGRVYVGGWLGPTAYTSYPLTIALDASTGGTVWIARYDLRDPASFSTPLLAPAESAIGIGVDARAGLVVAAIPEYPVTGEAESSLDGALLLAYSL